MSGPQATVAYVGRRRHVDGHRAMKSGGGLENTAAMANHASTRTTELYDRRHEEISLGEVQRVLV